MKKLVLCMCAVSSMFLIGCGGGSSAKDWKSSVAGKTFEATNGVSIMFDNDSNISVNLGFADETNEVVKALSDSIGSMLFIYIASPETTNAIYEVDFMGQKTYSGYYIDGNNIYLYENGTVTNTNNLNWDKVTEDVYTLK